MGPGTRRPAVQPVRGIRRRPARIRLDRVGWRICGRSRSRDRLSAPRSSGRSPFSRHWLTLLTLAILASVVRKPRHEPGRRVASRTQPHRAPARAGSRTPRGPRSSGPRRRRARRDAQSRALMPVILNVITEATGAKGGRLLQEGRRVMAPATSASAGVSRGAVDGEGADRGECLSAVEEGEAFLGFEAEGLDAGGLWGRRGLAGLSAVPGFTFADGAEREVGEARGRRKLRRSPWRGCADGLRG